MDFALDQSHFYISGHQKEILTLCQPWSTCQEVRSIDREPASTVSKIQVVQKIL